MMISWEVRWFFNDQGTGTALRDSFFDETERGSVAERRDWYATPANPRCGIKFRDGQFQTKFLCGGPEPHAFRHARGQVARWQRWSLPVPDAPPPDSKLLTQAGWAPVDKRRLLKFFRCKANALEPVERVEDAECQLEWTEVRCGDRPFWTVGFEAAARGGDMAAIDASKQALIITATLLLRSLKPADLLTLQRSLSYPEWLVANGAGAGASDK